MTENNKHLIPLDDANLPAAIERRTQIANKMLGQISANQTEALFRKNPEFFRQVVSRYYPLDEELIEYFGDCLDWKTLPWNKELPWCEDLIERFGDWWDWECLSRNQALPWNKDIITRYKEIWAWNWLSSNEVLPWSTDFIERFEGQWNWGGLSQNKGIPWNVNLIERFKDQWDWDNLSRNEALPWSIDFFKRFENRWNWESLGWNEVLPWTIDLIEQFKEHFEDSYYWRGLSGNKALPWSRDLIERYAGWWERYWLSKNEAFPWSIGFLEHYEDLWHWSALSGNKALPWSIAFIDRYKDRWYWDDLSSNTALPWSHHFYERFSEKWTTKKVAYIYDANACSLSHEQVTRLLTELTSQSALKDIYEGVQRGVQGDATKQVNGVAYKLGDILPDGSIVFHIDASGKHGLATQPSDERGKAVWNQAKLLAEAHGQGWRLPTINELNLLYQQKDVVGNFANYFYWVYAENDSPFGWSSYFSNGCQNRLYGVEANPLRVRAILDF